MHAALERLLVRARRPGHRGVAGAGQRAPGRAAGELAATEGASLGLGGPEVVRAGALRAIEADLRRYLAHEAAAGCEWRPFGLELRFGFDYRRLAAAAGAGRGRRPGPSAGNGRSRRRRRPRPRAGPGLQERRRAARAPVGPLDGRSAPAGGAVHARRARAAGSGRRGRDLPVAARRGSARARHLRQGLRARGRRRRQGRPLGRGGRRRAGRRRGAGDRAGGPVALRRVDPLPVDLHARRLRVTRASAAANDRGADA